MTRTNKNPEIPTASSTMLQEVQEMRPEAWGRLVEIFGPIVYRWCRASGLAGQDSSDVVQEVFISVARGVANFHRSQADQSFRSWLATITRNRVADFFRRQAKTPRAAGGTEAQMGWQGMAENLEQSISVERLDGALSRRVMNLVRSEFEERTWLAFQKTVMDGRKPSHVAEEMGISVASVYQAKSRIIRRLRQQLDEIPR